MQRRILHNCAMLAAMLIAGCNEPAPAPVPTTAPATTQAAATQPALRPAAIIHINDQPVVFPPARLRLEHDGSALVAMLFSDDPKEALKNNYTGNSFYLRMELEAVEPENLSQTEWHYEAPSSSEREDTPYGIFLIGRKTQLEPFNVKAGFRKDGDGVVTVFLAGEFRIIDANSDRAPARMATVNAELTAHLDKIAATQR